MRLHANETRKGKPNTGKQQVKSDLNYVTGLLLQLLSSGKTISFSNESEGEILEREVLENFPLGT